MNETRTPDIRIGHISSQWAKGSNVPCRYERTTGSTNDLAKDEAFDAAAEDAIKAYFTDHQTKGRGRGNNVWTDTVEGSGLLSSWSFALQDPPQPTLTPRLGLALARALSATWNFLPWSIKAPNDIYLFDKKVAGLLVETVTQGLDVRLIVGLGLNVWSSPDLPHATEITAELPENTPLLGEDWIGFLDRWLFELSDAVGRADQPLNSTECFALQDFMNRRPNVPRVDQVLPDGSLVSEGKTTPWMEI